MKPPKQAARHFLLLLLIGLSFGSAFGLAQDPARKMALTFDDLPQGGPPLPLPEVESMTRRILSTLEQAQAPAIGLVNESKLLVPGEMDRRTGLLVQWLESGAELGNHTFSHPDLNRITPTEFIEDILRGEQITSLLLSARGSRLVYFRHPFLHTGKRHQDRGQVESFLARRNYRIAPVTMENSDWIFNVALLEAEKRGDRELLEKVSQSYLDFTGEMIRFFEEAAQAVLERPIPHVMLLHANVINARLLGTLLEKISERGYRYVTLEEALSDPAYGLTDSYLGEAGPGWIFRWDVGDGKRDFDWRTEPEPPAFVVELYQQAR